MSQMRFWFELLDKKRTHFHEDMDWIQGRIDYHTTAPHKNDIKASKAKGARFALRFVIDWMDEISINLGGTKGITLDNYKDHFYSPEESAKQSSAHLKFMFFMIGTFIISLIILKVLIT